MEPMAEQPWAPECYALELMMPKNPRATAKTAMPRKPARPSASPPSGTSPSQTLQAFA